MVAYLYRILVLCPFLEPPRGPFVNRTLLRLLFVAPNLFLPQQMPRHPWKDPGQESESMMDKNACLLL